MKKFVKIAAIVVAVVLVIALVAPMVLRGKIAEIVKREANAMLDARLDFEKLDISLLRHFPRASLDLKGLTLVGEEPFAGDTIVAAQRISVVVNVMSLFGDEGFEVTKIILSEPALHAHKLADGRVNWDVVKASEEAQGEGSGRRGDPRRCGTFVVPPFGPRLQDQRRGDPLRGRFDGHAFFDGTPLPPPAGRHVGRPDRP